MARRSLLVCSGSHCRRALRSEPRLEKALKRLPVEVVRVPCQKVCRGPVVGVQIEGRWQWFRRVDSKKAVRDLVDLVENGAPVGKSLAKRQDEKRAGKRR